MDILLMFVGLIFAVLAYFVMNFSVILAVVFVIVGSMIGLAGLIVTQVNTPEPASLLLWGLMGAIGAFAMVRRRRLRKC